ncbi:MAG: acetyltransferase [Desulfovibrionaceae bacterium]|nr:acetyltransferase [Desulfovibrionaceae bacterium]
MQKILLAGNGITARIMYGYLLHDTRYQVEGCVVDDDFVSNAVFKDVKSFKLSEIQQHFPKDKVELIMAVGYAQVNQVRQSLFERLKDLGYHFHTYIHPKSTILSDKPIGEGSILLPGALVEPNASIGRDCFLFGNVVVAHDAVIEDHCWLAAGCVVAGMARVGQASFLGVNATISNKVEIGAHNIVGGSAFMTRSTKPNMVHLARSGEPFRCSAEEYAKYFGV